MLALVATLRVVLAATFIISGMSKLRQRADLTAAIDRYGIVAPRVASRLAAVLPPLECALGALYLLGLGLPFVSLICALLVSGFTVAIVVNLRSGRRFPCNCFGGSRTLISPATVLRNLLLLAAALWVGSNFVTSDSWVWSMPSGWQEVSGGAFEGVAVLGTACLSLTILFLLVELEPAGLLSRPGQEKTE